MGDLARMAAMLAATGIAARPGGVVVDITPEDYASGAATRRNSGAGKRKPRRKTKPKSKSKTCVCRNIKRR